MVEVKDLTKNYGGRPAIYKLNFTVNKGEVVGFLGPNGAGKSTTMKIITGFMAPTSGDVMVAGHDVFSEPIEVKKRIGYLPETPPVYGDMYVNEYLAYVARLRGVRGAEVQKKVQNVIEKVSLGDVQKRLIQNLSKGYKQRVGIAQALVSDPEILILDEPTVGLDPKQVAEIRKLIQNLKGQHTIILSTHILPEVQASCERIIIINRGKIIAEDSLSGLSQRLSGGRRVTIKVKRPSQEAVQNLEALDGVRGVSLSNQSIQLEVDSEEKTLEVISQQIVEQNMGLLEMQALDMGLEDIFIKLTDEDFATGGVQ